MELSGNTTSRIVSTSLIPPALLGIFVLLFHTTFATLLQRWTKWDESLSHGLIVNAVFVYLLVGSLPWDTRQRSLPQKILALAFLGLSSLAWLTFQLISINLLEQLTLLALLFGLFAGCYGFRTAFSHRMLLLLPVFSLPVWDGMTDQLVNLSSIMVGVMIRVLDMPAIIEGNSIIIPAGHIIIADGCSGIRYFQIALALAFIIGVLNDYGEKRLFITLLIAGLIGLAANWIRIFIIVIVGYETEMQSSLMHDHEYFGWALFAAIMLPAIYFAPASKISNTGSKEAKPAPEFPMIALSLLALATGPALSQFVSLDPKPLSSATPLAATLLPVMASDMPVVLVIPEGAQSVNGLLETPEGKLFAEVDRYQRQSAKDKLVPYIVRLFSNKQWVANELHPADAPAHLALTRFSHKSGNIAVLQAQWFQVGNFTTDSASKAKLLQIPTLLSGNDGFAIFTVQTPCEDLGCDAASTHLLKNLGRVFANGEPAHQEGPGKG